MKTILHLAAIASLLAPVSAIGATEHPTISMRAARATALAAVPDGRIRSAELEREHGQLIYSFDIAVPHHSGIEEVEVSAVTGRIVSRSHESPAAERREVASEAREPGHR